jgi:V/A-type H+-transporting ATPase subunit E
VPEAEAEAEAQAQAQANVLLAEIQSQSEAERERILEEGRRRVEAIRARSAEAIRGLEADAERRLARRLAVDRDRILGEARLDVRARVLAERREWIGRAFQEARQRLGERCASPEYPDLLRRLIREAAEAAGREGELQVARQDLELCRRLAAELGLKLEIRAVTEQAGTVIVATGDRRADNGLWTRLEEAGRSLEQAVAQLLFGGHS